MVGKKKPLVFLTRGGILIPTATGNIQFGIPPETIKDAMKLGCGVPDTYIVPRHMFDLHSGVALAEMEFPVYFNFFIKKGRTRIICNENQRKRIETVASEALFGPKNIDHLHEFVAGENTPGFPNFKAEMQYFRKTMKSEGTLQLTDLIEFCVLDGQGKATYNGIEIECDSFYNIRILENGKQIAFINKDMPVIPRKTTSTKSNLNFRPPLFGVTTLGAGHGFDPDSDTSGLIIWVNRRGIMVDPPVHSTERLMQLGVSPKWIDNIILTHCHADHDTGTLQKILQEGKLNLYTTDTIYKSFMKKSSALTGITKYRLKSLVHFYPVCIGKPMIIDGARFNFNYTLHSIPTISIQVSLHGKSMVYSSDTMNDPQHIDQLYADGVLTKNRRDFLINFPWDHDVIFHEAGIPPIHTPLNYLCSLPENIRKKMYLVHVNSDTIPSESCLKIAPTGLANTIELNITPPPHDDAIEILDAFSSVELFDKLTFEKAREFLLTAEVERYKKSEIIFRQGDKSDKFFIVMSGEVDIILSNEIITTYGVGGYFGEKGLFHDENRTATARVRTEARLLSIRKNELLSLIRGTESESMLRQIADHQDVQLRNTLKNNQILGNLTATQQTNLHGLIKPLSRCFSSGEIITDPNSPERLTYIIKEGMVNVYQDHVFHETLTKGVLFGVKPVFNKKDKNSFSFVAQKKTSLYYIEHASLKQYLDTNPGVYIKMFHIPY